MFGPKNTTFKVNKRRVKEKARFKITSQKGRLEIFRWDMEIITSGPLSKKRFEQGTEGSLLWSTLNSRLSRSPIEIGFLFEA